MLIERRNKTKKIYVLLTCFPDAGSKFLRAVTGFQYTHASIGLEEDMNTFYSFVEKGFIVEKIDRYIKPDRIPFPCRLYELPVSEGVYDRVKEIANLFTRQKKELRYTRMGVLLGLMRIPYRKRKQYFCSQFVAEVLEKSRAMRLSKNSALYFPEDLSKLPDLELHYQGNLQGMLFWTKNSFA